MDALAEPDFNLANEHFSTPHNHCNVNPLQWAALFNSIPESWIGIIKGGNQNFLENEFLALPLPHDEIGDVYRYNNGNLTFYSTNPDGIIDETDQIGLPGSLAPNHNTPYPNLNELKRIHVSFDKQVINFMLPYRKSTSYFKAGAIIGSYTHPLAHKVENKHSEKGIYPQLAKLWRSSLSTMHPDTMKFVNESGLQYDVEKGVSELTKTIRNLRVLPSLKVMLHKIINTALYVGEIAHNYQVTKKNVSPNDTERIVSHTCIYSSHTYDPNYVPSWHKGVSNNSATYQWVLWDSPIAKLVWKECKLILSSLGLNLNLNSYHNSILNLMLNPDPDQPSLSNIRAIIAQNLQVFALWVLYTSDKEINTLKQNNKLDDKTIDEWPQHVLSHYLRLVQDEIKLLPHHDQDLQIKAKRADPITGRKKPVFDAREQQLKRISLPIINLEHLSDEHTYLYSQTWCALDALVEITNGALVVKPFRREPP